LRVPAWVRAKHTAILAGHTHWVWCAAFAPDAKTLATASKAIAALCVASGDTGVAAIATQERPGRTKNVLWRTGRISRDAGNSNQSF
jgi:WD40 repeat protein